MFQRWFYIGSLGRFRYDDPVLGPHESPCTRCDGVPQKAIVYNLMGKEFEVAPGLCRYCLGTGKIRLPRPQPLPCPIDGCGKTPKLIEGRVDAGERMAISWTIQCPEHSERAVVKWVGYHQEATIKWNRRVLATLKQNNQK